MITFDRVWLYTLKNLCKGKYHKKGDTIIIFTKINFFFEYTKDIV